MFPTIPAGDVDGGGVGVTVVASNIIHTTWEGSGLHTLSSPHTELGTDGLIPGC